MVVERRGKEEVAYPLLVDSALEELPFDVEEVAILFVGTRGLPAVDIGAEGDVGEVEEGLALGAEALELDVGIGVDEGDAGAERMGVGGGEVGEVAKLGGGVGKGKAHGRHADDDKVYEAGAVGSEQEPVEGEVVGAVALRDKGLPGDGLVDVDHVGLEGGVGLLRKGAEQLARDGLGGEEVALGHLCGVAAQVAQGVPALDVVLVLLGLVVFADDEDGGGKLYLTGAQGGGVGGVAVVDDEGEAACRFGKGSVDEVAQAAGVGGGEDDPGLVLKLGFVVEGLEEVDKGLAAPKDEDMVGEVVAGASVTVVVAPVEEDGGEGGDQEGGEERRADNDNEELEKQREARAKGEVAGIEEEAGGFGPAGYAAGGGEGHRCRGPDQAKEPEEQQQECPQSQRPKECFPCLMGME